MNWLEGVSITLARNEVLEMGLEYLQLLLSLTNTAIEDLFETFICYFTCSLRNRCYSLDSSYSLSGATDAKRCC